MNVRVNPAEHGDAQPAFVMPRFDQWEGYDEADVRAFAFVLPQVGFDPSTVGMRYDDAGIYFARALDYVKTAVYTVRRPQRSLIHELTRHPAMPPIELISTR